MIKNLIKSVFSLGFFTLGIGFSYGYILPIGSYGTNMINSYSQNYDIQITKNGTFLSQFGGLTKKVFVSGVNGSNPIYTFWTERGLPYVVFPSNGQGYYKWYYYCNTAVVPNWYPTTSNGACSSVSIDLNNYSGTVEFFETFLSTLTTEDNVYYGNPSNLASSSNAFCIGNSSLGKSLCFQINYNVIDGNRTDRILENLNMPEAFNSIDSTKLFDPPGVGNSGSDEEDELAGIVPDSTESALNLYENRYGRNKSICYVGINNSSTLWGSSVSFQEGSGLTIFQLYDQLYGTGDLDHYYVFVNNWLLNYEQWFNTSGNPMYLSNYNSGTNQVELYYDNLSFPFANNPIAVYFMASNITSKSPSSTMGSSVVSYCNIKLNNGTFDDIIDEADKINAIGYTENTNVNNGYNADGTVRKINIGEFNMNTGSWVISGNLDGGSFTEDYGVSYNTGFNNVSEGFQNLFDKLDSVFSSMSSLGNAYTGILPSYIVFAFLFVVLFKIMRR